MHKILWWNKTKNYSKSNYKDKGEWLNNIEQDDDIKTDDNIEALTLSFTNMFDTINVLKKNNNKCSNTIKKFRATSEEI